MRARVILAASALAVAPTLAPLPAHADYGPGTFDYREWTSLKPGMHKSRVEAICGCRGRHIDTKFRVSRFKYDNTVTGGHVEILYVVQRSGAKLAYGSYWYSKTSAQKGPGF